MFSLISPRPGSVGHVEEGLAARVISCHLATTSAWLAGGELTLRDLSAAMVAAASLLSCCSRFPVARSAFRGSRNGRGSRYSQFPGVRSTHVDQAG